MSVDDDKIEAATKAADDKRKAKHADILFRVAQHAQLFHSDDKAYADVDGQRENWAGRPFWGCRPTQICVRSRRQIEAAAGKGWTAASGATGTPCSAAPLTHAFSYFARCDGLKVPAPPRKKDG